MKANGHRTGLEPAIKKVAAKAHHAVDRAAAAASSPTRLVAEASDYVSANPLRTVGAAVVAGFVLGRILF